MKLPEDPSTPQTSVGWVVVSAAYANARRLPDAEAEIVEVLRQGTVFQCPERKIDPAGQASGGLWYRFDGDNRSGWIHDSEMRLFPTKDQARRFSDSLGATR